MSGVVKQAETRCGRKFAMEQLSIDVPANIQIFTIFSCVCVCVCTHARVRVIIEVGEENYIALHAIKCTRLMYRKPRMHELIIM